MCITNVIAYKQKLLCKGPYISFCIINFYFNGLFYPEIGPKPNSYSYNFSLIKNDSFKKIAPQNKTSPGNLTQDNILKKHAKRMV